MNESKCNEFEKQFRIYVAKALKSSKYYYFSQKDRRELVYKFENRLDEVLNLFFKVLEKDIKELDEIYEFVTSDFLQQPKSNLQHLHIIFEPFLN